MSKRHTWTSANKAAEIVTAEEFERLFAESHGAFTVYSKFHNRKHALNARFIGERKTCIFFEYCGQKGGYTHYTSALVYNFYCFEFYNVGRIVRAERPIDQDIIDEQIRLSLMPAIDSMLESAVTA